MDASDHEGTVFENGEKYLQGASSQEAQELAVVEDGDKALFDRHLWVPCRDTVASGLAIGMFFSMILVLPLQMLFAAVLAMRFRANVPFAMAACWVSNVFTNVPLGLSQVWLGNWMMDVLSFPMPHFLRKVDFNVPEIGEINAAAWILGMMVSAVLLALASYPLVHIFSVIMPHHLPVLKKRPLSALAKRIR